MPQLQDTRWFKSYWSSCVILHRDKKTKLWTLSLQANKMPSHNLSIKKHVWKIHKKVLKFGLPENSRLWNHHFILHEQPQSDKTHHRILSSKSFLTTNIKFDQNNKYCPFYLMTWTHCNYCSMTSIVINSTTKWIVAGQERNQCKESIIFTGACQTLQKPSSAGMWLPIAGQDNLHQFNRKISISCLKTEQKRHKTCTSLFSYSMVFISWSVRILFLTHFCYFLYTCTAQKYSDHYFCMDMNENGTLKVIIHTARLKSIVNIT